MHTTCIIIFKRLQIEALLAFGFLWDTLYIRNEHDIVYSKYIFVWNRMIKRTIIWHRPTFHIDWYKFSKRIPNKFSQSTQRHTWGIYKRNTMDNIWIENYKYVMTLLLYNNLYYQALPVSFTIRHRPIRGHIQSSLIGLFQITSAPPL